MQCPSCGALQEIRVEQCPASKALGVDMAETPNGAENNPQASKLIEFPGVSRNSVPAWRKVLSERVREVQEKRAREAALEAAERGPREKDEASSLTPQLELLPQADVAPLNPLVSAALRRIERAHHAAQSKSHLASAPGGAALAYAPDSEYRTEALPEFEVAVAGVGGVEPQDFHKPRPTSEPAQPEKVHNLVVVSPQVTKTENQKIKPKPRRMIVENDSVLNYLDSVPTSGRLEVVKYRHAPAFSRILGAVVDLMVVALPCAPFAALVELTNGNWQDLKVAVTGAAIFCAMSFLYFTISTALTGRTLGMRLFSLRIVDARTGLIPTGKQSAGRALIYLATILTLGLASLYALIDRDQQTVHDRLTRTTVITL